MWKKALRRNLIVCLVIGELFSVGPARAEAIDVVATLGCLRVPGLVLGAYCQTLVWMGQTMRANRPFNCARGAELAENLEMQCQQSTATINNLRQRVHGGADRRSLENEANRSIAQMSGLRRHLVRVRRTARSYCTSTEEAGFDNSWTQLDSCMRMLNTSFERFADADPQPSEPSRAPASTR